MNLLWIEDSPEIKIKEDYATEIIIRDKTEIDGEIKVRKPSSFVETSECINDIIDFYDYVIIDIDLTDYPDFIVGSEGNPEGTIFNEYYAELEKLYKEIHIRDKEVSHLKTEEKKTSSEKDKDTNEKDKALIEPMDVTIFKRVAGFVVYLLLLEKGFPKENISFYTANADSENGNNTYDIFLNRFYNSLIRQPNKCFIKNENNPLPAIISWVRGEQSNEQDERKKAYDYLKFRRHVIETCDYVLANLHELSHSFNINNPQDYFERMKRILPVQIKTKNERDLFRYFLREMSAPFDKIELKKYENNYYVEISKIIRNWLAHDKLKGTIELNDAIFLSSIILHAVSSRLDKIYFHFAESEKEILKNPELQRNISESIIEFNRGLLQKVLPKNARYALEYKSMLQALINCEEVGVNYFYQSLVNQFSAPIIEPRADKNIKTNPRDNSISGVIYLNIKPSNFNPEGRTEFEKELLLFSLKELKIFYLKFIQ